MFFFHSSLVPITRSKRLMMPEIIIISHDEEEFVREGEPQTFEATISDSNNATNTLFCSLAREW